MGLFAPKGFRAEVTEGIDIEEGLTLAGQRVVIGSGPGDDLRLGAGDVVPAHLTFERRADGKGWEYFSSDRGYTEVDRGNPRTGTVRAGMSFRLGGETRIVIQKAAAPAETDDQADDGPKTIPLSVALPAMGAMIAIAGLAVVALSPGGSSGASLRTAPLVTGDIALPPVLDRCLGSSGAPARLVPDTDPASPFWRVLAHQQSDPVKADAALTELTDKVRSILAKGYFLSIENKNLEASEALRRLEYVLPVGTAPCPILSASRFDVALLELRGSN